MRRGAGPLFLIRVADMDNGRCFGTAFWETQMNVKNITNVSKCMLCGFLCTLSLLISGCGEKGEVPSKVTNSVSDDVFYVPVVGYDHRDEPISFDANGVGAALGPHDGGGNFTCCVGVGPWRPGLSVRIRWNGRDSDDEHEETVLVPEYDINHAGHVAVHFLSNGEIKVFITQYYPRNENYPLKWPDSRL